MSEPIYVVDYRDVAPVRLERQVDGNVLCVVIYPVDDLDAIADENGTIFALPEGLQEEIHEHWTDVRVNAWIDDKNAREQMLAVELRPAGETVEQAEDRIDAETLARQGVADARPKLDPDSDRAVERALEGQGVTVEELSASIERETNIIGGADAADAEARAMQEVAGVFARDEAERDALVAMIEELSAP